MTVTCWHSSCQAQESADSCPATRVAPLWSSLEEHGCHSRLPSNQGHLLPPSSALRRTWGMGQPDRLGAAGTLPTHPTRGQEKGGE